jgi:pimeloyl-ACP methyl ester carboxylesterase
MIAEDNERKAFVKKLAKFLVAHLNPRTYRVSCEVMDSDATEVFRKVKQPTIIIWGKNDSVFPADAAKKIKELISNSRIVKVKGTHDWCLLKPDKLAEIFEQSNKRYK